MVELQLDGLPGPTLFHGGLGQGNLASQANARAVSHPRAGARACLAKMRTVLELGVAQAFLPPLTRPDLAFLAACGCQGVADAPPDLLAVACSTAFQWTANAGTFVPAADSGASRLLIANLAAQHHRSREAAGRQEQLRRFIPGISVLDPLPAHPALGDEGAANHSRVVGSAGVCHVFVHGEPHVGARFQPRQTAAASAAVARRLGLSAAQTLFVRQLPATVDSGAFHNDVVMVGSGDHLLLHARAWVDQEVVLAELLHRCGPLRIRVVSEDELALDAAIRCYLFNSQLLTTPAGMVLVAPAECAEGPAARVVQRLIDEGFITRTVFVAVRESMRGGGGPACLRLRLELTPDELATVAPGIRLDPVRITALESWVDAHYRSELRPADLADPALVGESQAAALTLAALIGDRG